MRTKFSVFGILAIVLLATCQASGQAPLKWESNLETATSRASMLNRLVLVHFWAPWCTACHKMEQEVFSQPDVQAAIQADFVAVRINVDHNRALAERYGVTYLPTDIVITPDGRLLERQPGYTERHQYISRLRQIALDARRQPPVAATNPRANVSSPMVDRPAVSHSSPPPVPAWPNANQPQSPPIASIPGGPTRTQTMAPNLPELAGPNAPNTVNPPRANQPPPVSTPYGNPQVAQNQPPLQPSPQQPNQWQYSHPPLLNGEDGQLHHYHNDPQAGRSVPPLTQAAQAPPQINPLQQPLAPHNPMQQAPINPPVANNPSAPVPPKDPTACAFAMDGFCPVELVENKNWKLGDVRWGANHRGRTYLFSGPEQQQRFLKSPDRYSPVASGIDVVLALTKNQVAPGRREYGVFCANRIFLFASEESLAAFSDAPERYIEQLQLLDQGQPRPEGPPQR